MRSGPGGIDHAYSLCTMSPDYRSRDTPGIPPRRIRVVSHSVSAEPSAIGFRDHTGWAVAVVLSGTPDAPRLVHRERMELLDADLPRQVFHAVAEAGADRSLIGEVAEAARRRTASELTRLLVLLRQLDVEIDTVAVPTGKQAIPSSLDSVLASHALLHAAEGELYRDCLADAAATLGLRLARFGQRDLLATAAMATGRPQEELASRTSAMGRLIGPPWQKDHREAATAAWLGLAMRARTN